MSRPFNFTTDSTWPFSVSSSLNLEWERIRKFSCCAQLLHYICFMHKKSWKQIVIGEMVPNAESGRESTTILYKCRKTLSICRFKHYLVWWVFYIPCNLSSSLCLFSHLIKLCEITAITKRQLRLGRLQPMEGPLCMCPFELLFFFPKILFPRESNLQYQWF